MNKSAAQESSWPRRSSFKSSDIKHDFVSHTRQYLFTIIHARCNVHVNNYYNIATEIPSPGP